MSWFKRQPKHTHTWEALNVLWHRQWRDVGYLEGEFCMTTWLELFCTSCGETRETQISRNDWPESAVEKYVNAVYPTGDGSTFKVHERESI